MPKKRKNRVTVGGIRGIALAILAAAGVEAADVVATKDLPDSIVPVVAVVVLALRVGEAVMDQLKKGNEPPERNVVGL